MKNNFHGLLVCSLALSLLLLTGCNSNSSTVTDSTTNDTTTATDDDTSTDTDDTSTDTTPVTLGALDISNFVAGALKADPEIVDCTLSDGTETTCHQLVTAGAPVDTSTIGPFCPKTIYDQGADAGGLWFDGSGTLYEVDGDFIVSLPNIYNTDYPGTWELYDSNGDVKITDTQTTCEDAAQPNVPDELNNYCVECSVSYFDDDFELTYLIPVTPVPVDSSGSSRAEVGIALNGSQIAGPAPVTDILSNITIAAFDDCGGHINLNQGYHYHASTGCSEVGTQADGHSAMIGYALDGYGIYGLKDSKGEETSGLDDCRGITDDVRGYHYHAAAAEDNMTIGCFHGATASTGDDTDDAGGPPDGGPGDGGPPGGPQ